MLSYVVGAVALVVSGVLSDVLIRKKKMSIVRTRRLTNILGMSMDNSVYTFFCFLRNLELRGQKIRKLGSGMHGT